MTPQMVGSRRKAPGSARNGASLRSGCRWARSQRPRLLTADFADGADEEDFFIRVIRVIRGSPKKPELSIALVKLAPFGSARESRSFFECREEGGRYFWRNASIPAAAYPAYMSKSEILGNPRVRNDCVEPNGVRGR